MNYVRVCLFMYLQIMEDMHMIVGSTSWSQTSLLKWEEVMGRIVQRAEFESQSKSRLRELLADVGKDGRLVCIK